jgi:kinesin family protein 18/19
MSKEAAFNVVVRLRPLVVDRSPRFQMQRSHMLEVDHDTVTLKAFRDFGAKAFTFTYDQVFLEDSSNEAVYQQALRPLVQSFLEGFNATCFAYGNTGAGKTYTVLGTTGQLGLVHLALQDCFEQLTGVSSVKVSYLEVYNEQVRDLLAHDARALLVVEDPVKGVVVPGLTELVVEGLDQVNRLVDRGNRLRTMAATSANQFSTRSHAILQMTLERREGDESQTSKLSLIDLAGSERASSTENRGQRMIEGASINRSLLALGSCINILSDPKQRGKFVPYRDSKITRLLKDSLGGNTKTLMVACVCGAAKFFEETLNTLRYASRARSIKHKVNASLKQKLGYGSLVESLTSEISSLKSQLQRRNSVPEQSKPTGKDEAVVSDELERLSQQMMTNFEDYCEIKQSITEIEALNEENQLRIREILDSRQDDLGERSAELEGRQQSIIANEESRASLMEALDKNLKEKAALQQTLSAVAGFNQRQFLELQLSHRALKLEKVDLHLQNLKIMKEAFEARQQSEQKDRVIRDMQAQLDLLRLRLSRAPSSTDSAQPTPDLAYSGGTEGIVRPRTSSRTRRTSARTGRTTPRSPIYVPIALPYAKVSPLREARSQLRLKTSKPAQSSVTFLSNYVSMTRPVSALKSGEKPRTISQSPIRRQPQSKVKVPHSSSHRAAWPLKAPVYRSLSLKDLAASLNMKELPSMNSQSCARKEEEEGAVSVLRTALTDIQELADAASS